MLHDEECNFDFVCSLSAIEGSRFSVCTRVNTIPEKILIDYFSVIKLDAKRNAIQVHTTIFANYLHSKGRVIFLRFHKFSLERKTRPIFRRDDFFQFKCRHLGET